MKTLYLVLGSSGEYSGFREWPIAAHTDESTAHIHIDFLYKQHDEDEYEPTSYGVWKIQQYDSLEEWVLSKAAGK